MTTMQKALQDCITAMEYANAVMTYQHPFFVEKLEQAKQVLANVPTYPAKWAEFLHYPQCWDTAAYPTLESAIHEALAWSGCSVCKEAPEQEP